MRRASLAILIALLVVLAGWFALAQRSTDRPDEAVAADVGSIAEFPPGSVTELELAASHLDTLGLEGSDAPPASRLRARTRLFVVHTRDSSLLALLARSPWLGCRLTVVDRNAAERFGHVVPPDFVQGFLDPCHGGLYAADGHHLAGPGTLGLDRFPVTIGAGGRVTVDLTELQRAPHGT